MKQLDLVSNMNPKLYQLRYEGNHRYGEKSSTEVISFAPKSLGTVGSCLGRTLPLVLEKLL